MKQFGFIFCAFLIIWLASCVRVEEEKQEAQVSFSALAMNQFSNHSSQARVMASSTWQHIFAPEMSIDIRSREGGEEHSVNYDPSDFFLPYSVRLPFGSYSYDTSVDGEDFMDYLPFEAGGEFELNALNFNIVLEAETDYGLVTIQNNLVEEVLLNGSVPFALTEDGAYYYKYVRTGNNVAINIQSTVDGESFTEELQVEAYRHHHYYLQAEGANFIDLVLGEFTFISEGLGIGGAQNMVIDADGNIYRTVRIGTQNWMAENLKTTRFCNGDEVDNVPGGEAWIELSDPAYTYYDNEESYNNVFGKLYNEYAILDERNICPCGWKVPSREDFDELTEYLGGEGEAGGKLKRTGFDHWSSPNHGATNESRFSALPSGMFAYSTFESDVPDLFNYHVPRLGFNFINRWGPYWTTTDYQWERHTGESMSDYYVFMMSYLTESIFHYLEADAKGLAVRCIEDRDD